MAEPSNKKKKGSKKEVPPTNAKQTKKHVDSELMNSDDHVKIEYQPTFTTPPTSHSFEESLLNHDEPLFTMIGANE